MFVNTYILHNLCEVLFLHIFYNSVFQTVLQLCGFSIWKVNPSLKESSWNCDAM